MNKTAVVPKDHEAVVQVTHQTRKFQLEDAVERFDLAGRGRVRISVHKSVPERGRKLLRYLTNTISGREAIPLATTSRRLSPCSIPAGTSKWVDETCSDATAMLLWSCVRQ